MSRFTDVFLDDCRHRVKISTVVGEHVIWDKKKSRPSVGDMWACCPFHGEKSPSFHADDRKGIYHCFGCGVTGDHFRFLTDKVGYKFPQAVEYVARLAGISMPSNVRGETDNERRDREARLAEDRRLLAERQAQLEEEQRQHREARTENAAEVWDQTLPLIGTHGEGYIVGRGIAPINEWPWDPIDCIRFHPNLVSELDKRAGAFPAIVCKVVDAFSDFTSVWQIFLDRQKPMKAPLGNPKVGRGPSAGGAIRIGGDADDIDVSEGTETALGTWELQGYKRPSWSLMSSSMMAAWEPPDFIKRARINPDGDRGKLTKEGELLPPAGITAARTLHDRLVASGIPTPINHGARHGDNLDLLIARKKQEHRTPRGTDVAP